MNINLIRFKPVIKELGGIRSALERIADCMEIDLAERGYNIRPSRPDPSKEDPTVDYTDEAQDFIRETDEFIRHEEARKAKEEEDNG